MAPREGWITCNTDRASKGSPVQSAFCCCIRNISGDLTFIGTKYRGGHKHEGRGKSSMGSSVLLQQSKF